PLLLRGRRLRPLGGPPGRRLGRRPPRERVRVGDGRARGVGRRGPARGQLRRGRPAAPGAGGAARHRRRRPRSAPAAAGVRGHVGVDAERLHRLPRLPRRRRRPRRVQREVDERAVRAARRLLRDEPDPHPPHLSQLLPPGGDVAVHRPPPRPEPPMTAPANPTVNPAARAMLRDVLAGLSATPRAIPSKYLYDAEGSRLFDRITALDAYYPTRTELGILREHIDEIAECIGPGAVLIEYGSGSSTKTRLLLDALAPTLAAYVPIDISREHLLRTAERLRADYPGLRIEPVVADYT